MTNMVRPTTLDSLCRADGEIGRFEPCSAKGIIGHHSVSLKEVNYLCPLWLVPS